MEPDAAVTRYLDRYAEPESQLTEVAGKSWDHVLVIPAHRETAESVHAVWQKLSADFLAIVVINSNIENDDSSVQLARELAETSSPELLLVNKYSAGRTIPVRQGVGLARKIGCDIALSLITSGHVRSSWIHTTDADAVLPEDYFEALPTDDVAMVYPFRHIADEGVALEVSLYDLSLLVYPAGLKQAGSVYAFPTVGSTIACQAQAYARVRGFPRRNTGEDFYLLNKISKLGTIGTTDRTPIELSGRFSDRVPIGTGQAISRIGKLDDALSQYQFDHPDCFQILGDFLQFQEELCTSLPESCRHPDSRVQAWCESSGFVHHYGKKRQQSPSSHVMKKFLDDWFDGLRTRQFIHSIRDHSLGTVNATTLCRHYNIAGTDLTGLRARLAASIY